MANTRYIARNKFGVSKKIDRTAEGIVFDSKGECARYLMLKLLEKTGIITRLELQPSFVLVKPFESQGKRYRGVVYRADFRYLNSQKQICVEDFKGVVTADYRIKRELLLSQPHDFLFYEIKNPNEAGGTGVENGFKHLS